ncbi:MAG: sugar phosphate isomerase/epimerase family protein [Phycisphaerales bacterium]
MNIAFSTLACPDWTLADAVSKASDMGYLGVEMRSFLSPQERMASDPLSMSSDEVERVFDDAGVIPLCLATSVKYDKAIDPPLIGRIFVNEEAGVGDTKSFVDLADRTGTKFVRVYGCNLPAAEPVTWSMRRVTERLRLASQTCRNTDVRLLIENAGSFARSRDLLKLIETVDSQWLGASYNILASLNNDECPIEGVRTLGEYTRIVRICDVDDDGRPVRLGEGVVPVRELIRALGEMDYRGWVVYEYPKLWSPEPAMESGVMLSHAADTLYGWIKGEPAPA